MANKRNGANSVKYKNLKSDKNTVSTDSPVFDESNIDGENQIRVEQDILSEIKKVMEEGNYNNTSHKETLQDNDESQDLSTGRVFSENKYDTQYTYTKLDKPNNSDIRVSEKEISRRARREAKKAAYKKTTLKHKIKVMVVLMILGIFTGSGLGVWYFNFALNSNVDYSANPDDFVQSIDATLSRNFTGITESNAANWVAEAKAQGKTPADISPVDNYVLAEFNASLANSYTVVGVGSILTMGFDQYMYSERKFDGSAYSFVSISPTTNSFVGDIAVCDIMQKGAKSVKSFIGTNDVVKGDTSAEWKYDTTYDLEAYNGFAGVLVDSLTPYIIGEKTVLSSSDITVDEKGNYVFTLQLNTVSSVLRYVKQVKRTGDLALLPVFNEIKQTITMTADWQLVNIKIDEKYSAIKMGVNAPIKSSMNMDFTFNEPVTLPSVPPV